MTDKPLSPTDLKRLHRRWRRQVNQRVAIIVDGVQKPFNVGAIARSAAAYRVEHLWLVPPTPPLSDPKVAKVALGCQKLVTWSVVNDGTDAIQASRSAGFTLVAVELTASAEPLFFLPLDQPVCLVVGHENRGISKSLLQAVDATGYAPQLGNVGSLNVAHALSIALYETTRQAIVERRQ